jgi:pyruvate formate lyase activating enzyme
MELEMGALADTPLEAASPYELRLDLAAGMSEAERQAAVRSGELGFLHSFTTGSTVDGPGVRLVAWTTLCMFRCKYCHNPDTWTLQNGHPVTLAQATEELRKYAHGLKLMRGGFTLSGGEPLMQAKFAAKLFAAAKELGLHTAIETNGFYHERLTDADFSNIDLVILDMKGFSAEQHKRVTASIDNTTVLAFGRRMATLKRPMWLRYVLVPGLTDIAEEMEQIAAFGASLGVVELAEILPFHQMGHTQPPSQAMVQQAVDAFREAGLNAR